MGKFVVKQRRNLRNDKRIKYLLLERKPPPAVESAVRAAQVVVFLVLDLQSGYYPFVLDVDDVDELAPRLALQLVRKQVSLRLRYTHNIIRR